MISLNNAKLINQVTQALLVQMPQLWYQEKQHLRCFAERWTSAQVQGYAESILTYQIQAQAFAKFQVQIHLNASGLIWLQVQAEHQTVRTTVLDYRQVSEMDQLRYDDNEVQDCVQDVLQALAGILKTFTLEERMS